MKILMITSQIIEDTGTTYRCISNFYDILSRFKYLGELKIFAVRYNGKNSHNTIDKDLKGVVNYGDVSFIKKDYIFMSAANKKIIRERMHDIDLVISYGSSYDVYKLAREQNKKFMSFVVSCAWDAYWNHGILGKMLAPYKFLQASYTIKHSDYVLYVSNEFLQNRYPTDAKYQCGCSNVRIDKLDDSILEKRLDFIDKWDGKELRIATTGAVDVRYKGHEYMLRALYDLKQKGKTNIHYYLLGGGSPAFLQGLVKKYGIESQVHFMGIVPHDEVFATLDNMHLYIQPSLQEGLPRAMVEAMSRGLMCVGANTAAIPELIEKQFVTRRKSSDDIVKILENVTKGQLKEQAKRNFDEARNYEEEKLNIRRKDFFDKIINDINK